MVLTSLINIDDENNQSIVGTGNTPLTNDTGDHIQTDDRYIPEPEPEKEEGQSSTTLQRSARVQKPSFKFLSHFAESDSD